MAISTGNIISNLYNSGYAGQTKTSSKSTGTSSKTDNLTQDSLYTKSKDAIDATASTTKSSGDYGKTIGNVNLSDEAAKYYEELKKKYSNMDFILVSKDQKQSAQANAASYANSSKMVVLIDEEKIERMATDENYRKQYESIIENATTGLSDMKSQMESAGVSGSVQGYGMQVNDGGTTTFFAVLKKSSAEQKARIEKQAEEKKAEKKAEEKEAAEELKEKRAEKAAKEENAEEITDTDQVGHSRNQEDTVTITADSIEELMQKISAYTYEDRSNSVQTESELMVGQTIDFKG